jgi:hypothetical protein
MQWKIGGPMRLDHACHRRCRLACADNDGAAFRRRWQVRREACAGGRGIHRSVEQEPQKFMLGRWHRTSPEVIVSTDV